MNKTISFVIPVYNEEQRLSKTFKALSTMQLPPRVTLSEIIFVNDGSTDRTAVTISRITPKIERKTKAPVQLISYAENKGKGYAIREGMLRASGDYTLFFDADMSTPLSELKKFIPQIKKGIHVIVGTRKNGKSTVVRHQPLYREFLGKGFTKLTQFILRSNVTDFTCGFKAFSQQSKAVIFPMSKIHGWSYDAEILYLAQKYGFSLEEVPVLWANDERTKVKLLRVIPKTLGELVKIRLIHSRSVTFIQPSIANA